MSEPTDAPEAEDASAEAPRPTGKAPGGADRKDIHTRDVTRLLRIRVPIIAVMAEKRMKLAEVLSLNVGSIIQLNKPADELLDLMVNDQRVGRGETVRIGENFGLQLVEIGSPQETLRKLAPTPDEATPTEAAPTDTPADKSP